MKICRKIILLVLTISVLFVFYFFLLVPKRMERVNLGSTKLWQKP